MFRRTMVTSQIISMRNRTFGRYLSPYVEHRNGIHTRWHRYDLHLQHKYIVMEIYKTSCKLPNDVYHYWNESKTSWITSKINSLSAAKLEADEYLINKGYILCSEEQWEHLKLLQ